jgi:uncharacterized protein
MLFGLRAQSPVLVFLALSSPALCAAQDLPASKPPASVPAPAPFVALLLPLNAAEFAAPADAVRLGCQASLTHEPRLQVQLARTDARPESIAAEYAAAVGRGAAAVVGPMTRNGVNAIAAIQPGVPTLALNTPEGNAPTPQWLYTFSLAIESEARLVAQAGITAHLRDAIVVQAHTPLEQRATRAFADEWVLEGGKIVAYEVFAPGTDYTALQQRLAGAEAQVIFLAADADQARAVRPYLSNQIPVYGTSQIYGGRTGLLANLDLNGIRFVDMPWLVQPDHPAVMVYPRAEALPIELQRFYALGIDACRLAAQLMKRPERVSLDGVTGRIRLGLDRVFQREPVLAVIRENGPAAVEEPR